MPKRAVAESPADTNLNAVTLRGRLSADPESRTLPSGDVLVTFRVVVDRQPARRQQRRPVDAIDCAAWSARVQRTVRTWSAGDVVDVEGRLRRRFRRVGGAPRSRVEVEVTGARRRR